jgi:hypothetical protein
MKMMSKREHEIKMHGALIVRMVDRMMQFRYDRAVALRDGKYDVSKDEGPEHLTRFAEATALAAIVHAAKFTDLPMDYDAHMGDDIGAYFRLYELTEGHTLIAQDIRDIEAVLAEYNDEISNQTDKWQAAREQAFHDLGGPELVALMAAKDQAGVKDTVDRAMASVRAKLAEREDRP